MTYFIGIANIVACITLALTGSLKLNRFILYMSAVSLTCIGIFIAPFATTKVRQLLLIHILALKIIYIQNYPFLFRSKKLKKVFRLSEIR